MRSESASLTPRKVAGMVMAEVRAKKVENTQPMRLLMGNEGPGVARATGEKAIDSEAVMPAASGPPPTAHPM